MGVSTRRGPDQAWYSVPGLLLLWRRRAVARGAAPYSVPSPRAGQHRLPGPGDAASGQGASGFGRWPYRPRGLSSWRRPRKRMRRAPPAAMSGAGRAGRRAGARCGNSLADAVPAPRRRPRLSATRAPRMLAKWRSTTRLETRTKESDRRASVWVRETRARNESDLGRKRAPFARGLQHCRPTRVGGPAAARVCVGARRTGPERW